MPWRYEQSSGNFLLNTVFVGAGYCGNGGGLNNPAAQDQRNTGPIPQGRYAIGAPHMPPDHLGPLALPLYPDPANQMFGRFGFFIHGDNQFANHTASNGCIIASRGIRADIASSSDKTLVVSSGLHETALSDAAPPSAALVPALQAPDLRAMPPGAGPIDAYATLPVLPFQRTSVAMADVVAALKATASPLKVKRASYVMFRNESGNGAKGINNNYVGAQADGGRWPDSFTPFFAGTVTIRENGTGHTRIFLAFKGLPVNWDFLSDRLLSRGLYIGGQTHLVLTMDVNTPEDLAVAYHKEWVTGSATSEPSAAEMSSFLSMYHQATQLIT